MAEHSMCQPGRPRPHGLSQPGRSSVGGLPEDEVHRVALEGRDLDPGAGDHVLGRAAGERAVGGVAVDGEEDVAFGDVGVALLDQVAGHRDHGADVLGRARFDRGAQRADGVHVVVVPAGRLVGRVRR